MQSLRRVFLLSLLLLPLTACGGAKLPPPGTSIEGRILESGSNKPIPGAIVIVRWQGSYSQIVDTQTVCYHVETATTDEQGRYRTPAWKPENLGPHFTPGPYLIDAYKAGYERDWPLGFDRSEEFRKNTYYLKPFRGTPEERIANLAQFGGMQCGKYEGYAPKLLLLYKSIYEEADKIATTKALREGAINRLRDVEEMELGSDKSWENWRKRKRDLQ